MSTTPAPIEKSPEKTPDEVSEDSLDIELHDLYAANGKYTPEQKVEAVMAYLVTGTSRKASKICEVPEGTIRWWKKAAVWWMDVYDECKKKKQEELDASFTNVIHEGVEILADRMKNGDSKLVAKTGDVVNIPMSGRDVAISLAVMFDKRQLLRGEATSRSEKVSETDRLDKLQQQFEKMAQEVHGYNAKTIEGVEYDPVKEEMEKDVGKSE